MKVKYKELKTKLEHCYDENTDFTQFKCPYCEERSFLSSKELDLHGHNFHNLKQEMKLSIVKKVIEDSLKNQEKKTTTNAQKRTVETQTSDDTYRPAQRLLPNGSDSTVDQIQNGDKKSINILVDETYKAMAWHKKIKCCTKVVFRHFKIFWKNRKKAWKVEQINNDLWLEMAITLKSAEVKFTFLWFFIHWVKFGRDKKNKFKIMWYMYELSWRTYT